MHFVKKEDNVSEEEAAKKEAARAKKLHAYCQVRDRVFDKFEKGELDDEILELTAALLVKNPDLYTLWNIRRDALAEKKRLLIEANNSDGVRDLLESELRLTQACLESNPKSYSAWHERGWALDERAPLSADELTRELRACSHALSLDSRNFHCWDHWRFVCQLGAVSHADQLAFSKRLLTENSSNYSAWHVRATLLDDGELSAERLGEELELLEHALAVEPDDQSAWRFARWLIRKSAAGKEIGQAEQPRLLTKTLTGWNGKQKLLTLSFSRAVRREDARKLAEIDDASLELTAHSDYGKASRNRAHIWTALVESDLEGPQTVVQDELRKIYRIPTAEKSSPNRQLAEIRALCERVLALDNPEKPSAMGIYTHALCLVEIDAQEHAETIRGQLKRLADVLDPQRAEFYKHLLADLELGWVLANEEVARELLESGRLRIRSADVVSLWSLRWLGGLVREVDVLECGISDTRRIPTLPALSHLTLDYNPIQSLDADLSSRLPSLEFLSICGTGVQSVEETVRAVAKAERLDRLICAETPLAPRGREVADGLNESGGRRGQVRVIAHYM